MTRAPSARRWPTYEEKQLIRGLADHAKTRRAEHIAKYGEHVCVPDPNDPWSECDREGREAS